VSLYLKPKALEENYQIKKESFHEYIDKVKKNAPWDIYTIVNSTLSKNPYTSKFPFKFFSLNISKVNYKVLFLKSILKFYAKNIYLLFSYLIALLLYKIYFLNKKTREPKVVIDTFGLIDQVNKLGRFEENYFKGVYELLDKYKVDYVILLRLYKVGKNPFKLINFFKIINQENQNFIFEYEFFTVKDFLKLFMLILKYPFKTLRLLQGEQTQTDRLFNQVLIEDISMCSFDSFSRYILGKNIAKIDMIEKVYAWSEFQVIERSFNYGIRSTNSIIEINALQFFINNQKYFNAYIDELDFNMLSSPDKVFVNGRYYLQDRKNIRYDIGVSLRYKEIFNFNGIQEEKNIVLLGSYIERDTKYLLESVEDFNHIIFKNHPAVDISKFGKIPKNIVLSNDNIYTLFETTKLVISTSFAGTSVEAVACGISVIVVASQDNLTANPLVEYGQGKIWDIAFSQDDITMVYNRLIKYRNKNPNEIQKMAQWYKENFFVEPTEENIVKVFELDKERK